MSELKWLTSEYLAQMSEDSEALLSMHDIEGIPRFKISGMNQAEFIRHIFACGFNRGAKYQKDVEE